MAVGGRTRIRLCKQEGCKNAQTTAGYCRLHYLRNWKQLKTQQQKTSAERLNKYVERMTKKFPDRYVEEIKRDLKTRQFETAAEGELGEADDMFRLFNDPGYDEEVERLIHELKLEKEF
ncbi:MAG: hypothetical protein HY696_00700 [Deltaproteobacteria bacterium]|nr:hypothetical protein [Deltaproteobacteria bacterium]